MRKYVLAVTIAAASLSLAACKQETVTPAADVTTDAVATESVAVPVAGGTTTIVTPGATSTVTAAATPAMSASAAPMASETTKP